MNSLKCLDNMLNYSLFILATFWLYIGIIISYSPIIIASYFMYCIYFINVVRK